MARKKNAVTDPKRDANDRALRDQGWGSAQGARLEIEKIDTGEVVVGVYRRWKKLPDKGQKKGGHVIYLEVNGVLRCYGARTLLWEIMEGIDLGETVRIECTGTVASDKGNDAYTYEVRVKE